MKMNHIKSVPMSLAMAVLLFSCTNDDFYFKGDIVKSDLALLASLMSPETSLFFGSSVTFTDTPTGTASLWTWNMSGATPSYRNEANPTVLNESTGVHNESITVRNEHGADEIALVDYIEITAPPTVEIPY